MCHPATLLGLGCEINFPCPVNDPDPLRSIRRSFLLRTYTGWPTPLPSFNWINIPQHGWPSNKIYSTPRRGWTDLLFVTRTIWFSYLYNEWLGTYLHFSKVKVTRVVIKYLFNLFSVIIISSSVMFFRKVFFRFVSVFFTIPLKHREWRNSLEKHTFVNWIYFLFCYDGFSLHNFNSTMTFNHKKFSLNTKNKQFCKYYIYVLKIVCREIEKI